MLHVFGVFHIILLLACMILKPKVYMTNVPSTIEKMDPVFEACMKEDKLDNEQEFKYHVKIR